MRTATAITLVLLGGGATAMAVNNTRRCQDPTTGASIACSNYYGQSSGSHWFFHSYTSYSSPTGKSIGRASSSSSIGRGGFGASGSSHHAGS